jgi:hypothetical protein
MRNCCDVSPATGRKPLSHEVVGSARSRAEHDKSADPHADLGGTEACGRAWLVRVPSARGSRRGRPAGSRPTRHGGSLKSAPSIRPRSSRSCSTRARVCQKRLTSTCPRSTLQGLMSSSSIEKRRGPRSSPPPFGHCGSREPTAPHGSRVSQAGRLPCLIKKDGGGQIKTGFAGACRRAKIQGGIEATNRLIGIQVGLARQLANLRSSLF